MSEAPEARRETLTTAGVTSHVFDAEGDLLGHVLLLDLDGADLLDASKVADDLDGVSAVLRSSEGSWHVWGLGTRDLREATLTALSYGSADDSHVGASWRRGYAVLRAAPKVREEGEVYKDAPTVVRVSSTGAHERPQSRPHAAMLRSLVARQGEEVDGPEDALSPSHGGAEWVGEESDLRLDSYMTVTDAEKRRLRG